MFTRWGEHQIRCGLQWQCVGAGPTFSAIAFPPPLLVKLAVGELFFLTVRLICKVDFLAAIGVAGATATDPRAKPRRAAILFHSRFLPFVDL